VLIFDEAVSNLDQQTAEHFAQTINRLKGKVTMLFITHQVPKGLQVDEGAAAYYWQQQASESLAQEAHAATAAKAAPAVTANRLALGEAANAEALEVEINPPAELDFLTREAVLQMRRNAVRQYPMLLAANYSPRPAVFGQIEDLAPWWGIEGQFFHGSGIRSIDGPAEESRFILNPYLLVAAEFDDRWSKDLSESRLPGFPLICPPQQMIWKPREGLRRGQLRRRLHPRPAEAGVQLDLLQRQGFRL
jgi:hypothetical protein